MDAYIQVSLTNIFYVYFPIVFGVSISFLLCLSFITIFSLRISLTIEAYFCISATNIGNYLTLHRSFFCFSVSFCVCYTDSFVDILLLSTLFWSVRSRTIFSSCWINISLPTPLLFCSFFILDFNYFSFVSVWCDFFKALYLLLRSWDGSCLSFLLLLQS